MVPGQNSKNFQLTIFEFVQPKKNMSLSCSAESRETRRMTKINSLIPPVYIAHVIHDSHYHV